MQQTKFHVYYAVLRRSGPPPEPHFFWVPEKMEELVNLAGTDRHCHCGLCDACFINPPVAKPMVAFALVDEHSMVHGTFICDTCGKEMFTAAGVVDAIVADYSGQLVTRFMESEGMEVMTVINEPLKKTLH